MRLPFTLRRGAFLVHLGRVQLALRSAIAAGVALWLASVLELTYPIYVMIAAVIVTEATPLQTRQLALRRMVATVVGATLGALLCAVLPQSSWAVGLAILAAMLVSVMIGAPDTAKVAGYICGLVLLTHHGDAWGYAMSRSIETGLGITVAWLVSMVPRLITLEDSRGGHAMV